MSHTRTHTASLLRPLPPPSTSALRSSQGTELGPLCCPSASHERAIPVPHTLSSGQSSRSAVYHSLRPHELQHTRPPCPSPTPGVYSNSHPSSRWCHPAISSSVVPFSSCPQSLPASGSFPVSQLCASDGQSTGVSASTSVLPMNTQDWSPLGWTGWISLQSKGLSRVFSNTIVQQHPHTLEHPKFPIIHTKCIS